MLFPHPIKHVSDTYEILHKSLMIPADEMKILTGNVDIKVTFLIVILLFIP